MAVNIVALRDLQVENVLIHMIFRRCVQVYFAMFLEKVRMLRVPEIFPYRTWSGHGRGRDEFRGIYVWRSDRIGTE